MYFSDGSIDVPAKLSQVSRGVGERNEGTRTKAWALMHNWIADAWPLHHSSRLPQAQTHLGTCWGFRVDVQY